MEILLATLAVASLSLIGVFFFGQTGHMIGTHRYIVPFAIGSFLGIIFFELIPETLAGDSFYGAFAIVGGFLGFYVLSHVLHTYHHHHDHAHAHHHEPSVESIGAEPCETSRSTAALLLLGDAVHNFTDGIVIASAFLVNPVAGWVTAAGIALHEAPQEIAEFGVLRRAGYSLKEASFYNFLSATTVIVGAAVTVFLAALLGEYLWIILGIATGNLLYVAMSDLIPGVQASTRSEGRFYRSLVATIIGFILIVSLIEWSHAQFPHLHDHGEEHDSHEHTEHAEHNDEDGHHDEHGEHHDAEHHGEATDEPQTL
jgi:zinc and cadmium transporter